MGAIQSAVSGLTNVVAGAAAAGKKIISDEKQAQKIASSEADAQAKIERGIQEEAKGVALEADLIKMGADPESAHSFAVAKELGLETKGFGMVRKKGKFVGSFSSLAEKLSKDALTDTFSSRLINDKAIAARFVALGGSRKSRVQELVGASKGGK